MSENEGNEVRLRGGGCGQFYKQAEEENESEAGSKEATKKLSRLVRKKS